MNLKSFKTVRQIELAEIKNLSLKHFYVGCLILTKDNKILLQQRGTNWTRFPNLIAEFGGKIENEELPIEALSRELHEELEAEVIATDVISLGAIVESSNHHQELVYEYFWHDKNGTIKHCHEGKPIYFNNFFEASHQTQLMDSVRWLLAECKSQKLIF